MPFNYFKQFGGKITSNEISRYTESPNWNRKAFQNLENTSMDFSLSALPGFLKKRFWDQTQREPEKPIPVESPDLDAFSTITDKPKFIWFGHSVLLLQLEGKNILIDPMFGSNASPIAPFPTKRFSENTLKLIDHLPNIDAILFTHDHYDHLDFQSIQKLKKREIKYYSGLGLGRHLRYWGIPNDKIEELDWWNSFTLGNIKITYTPTRHFSGRGLRDRGKSLWGGWVFETPQLKVYFSGDGGYGNHFSQIKDRFKHFDFALIECGQYNENWKQIHLFPNESVKVGKEVNADIVMPVHWGGFALAVHPWKEPVRKFVQHATIQGLKYVVPRLGEIVNIGSDFPSDEWWEEYE
ncbi:MBL fold metallo-hydrolase [Membranihabitans maritimus]|uniref:MBL fold metallo-hydrolase n=1 Tax=Membranihabitans maritimus TaxID=2904244 RepID=UPI001F3D9D05|nr:MBL fold metallo-hydrolase [Membranihabitans maritimus]